MRALVTAAVSVAVGAALVAGCTSSSKSNADKSATAAKAKAKTTAPLVQSKLPSKISNSAAIRKYVTQSKCVSIPGGWSASGRATNPTKASRTYKITVFFTTTQATALNYAITTVKVAPGKSGAWTASKKFAAQKQMLCPMPGISAT